MATIALYANKMNQMPGLIGDVKKSVEEYKSELFSLKSKTLTVNKSVCDLDDVVRSIQSSTQTQEQKIASLETLSCSCEQFITDAARTDRNVADLIEKRKDDFYNKYAYLRPECEKNLKEKWDDFWVSAGEWCKDHWKELLITIVIVLGAALAIAAVICTGGMALAPMLAAGLTALGVSAGTAMTIATVTSLAIASIAVISTLASTTLNLMDTWGDYGNNPTFQSWKTAMNWVSVISNGFYSIGSIYNAVHGITNQSLREAGKLFVGKNPYLSQISTSPGSSAFWSGFGRGGDRIAADVAQNAGRETLEMTLEKAGVNMPAWNVQNPGAALAWKNASSAFAWKSTGNVTAILGENVLKTSIWRTLEYPLLQINPSITNIISSSGALIKYFSFSSLFSGLSSAAGSASSAIPTTH